MKQIRVIAPMGATIRGPAVLALTEDQFKRRASSLNAAKRKGHYHLGAGVTVMFKHGETLGIDEMDRLNRQIFEDLDQAAADAKAAADAEVKAKADADATAKAAGEGGQLPLDAGK